MKLFIWKRFIDQNLIVLVCRMDVPCLTIGKNIEFNLNLSLLKFVKSISEFLLFL